MSGPAGSGGSDATGEPSAARQAYLRLRHASGIDHLGDLERRLDDLETGVAEEQGLLAPLADRVARLEADLVPLLERRARRAATRDAGHRPGT